MSAQAAKVLRRDLRRAVGAEAIGVIDHNAKLLASLQQRLETVILLQNQHQNEFWQHAAQIEDHVAWHLAQSERTFWQRLRWLVTGK